MLWRVTMKLGLFLSLAISASLRDLEDRLSFVYIQRIAWSDGCLFLHKRFSNFCFCLFLSKLITEVKSAVRQLNIKQADTVWRVVNYVLQQAKLPEPNFKKELWDALKVLKEDDSIKVPPGDKGHASIVMNINNCHVKMSNLIKNRPYQLLNKEPTDRKVVQKAASLEVTWTSIRGHLQQHQTLSQKTT